MYYPDISTNILRQMDTYTMKRNILIVLVKMVSLWWYRRSYQKSLTEEERIEQVIIDIRDGIEQEILADVMETPP